MVSAHAWAPLVELGGSGISERFMWHDERRNYPLASRLGQGTVRQGECTPRDSRAGHWQNMQDRCGHVRRDRLTFKLCQAEDGLEDFVSSIFCC